MLFKQQELSVMDQLKASALFIDHTWGDAGAVGAAAGRGKRALESANSMPILSQFSASPIQQHTDQDCMLLEDNG